MQSEFDLLGTTATSTFDLLSNKKIPHCFFKKFDSAKDLMIRSSIDFGSLLIQPIAIVALSIAALIYFIMALASSLKKGGFRQQDCKNNFDAAAESLSHAGLLLITLVLSPIGNLISFIGSTVMTVESLIANDNTKEIRANSASIM